MRVSLIDLSIGLALLAILCIMPLDMLWAVLSLFIICLLAVAVLVLLTFVGHIIRSTISERIERHRSS